MGKSKKTRWRTFAFDGSKDETSQINGVELKLNGTDSQPNHLSENSQKYSQILGDHLSGNLQNYSSQLSNKNTSAAHHTYRARSYNNKENYYNQRSVVKNTAALASKNSWQRSSNTRTNGPSLNYGSRKVEENGNSGSSEARHDSTTTEPLKFNEDEYTRITTPRQDVLFKKGYLSRMNNKTVNNASSIVTSAAESTAPNSSITTNSDPDSSVSTLSPATTPSMEYGQVDPIEFAPIYYPGYYDENGMLVVPMYNGYNYYSPNGSSATTSPVFLMPYPYQYDPFFMAPNTEVATESEHIAASEEPNENEKEDDEIKNEKENNQFAEEQNGARMSSLSGDDAASNSSKHSNEEQTTKNEEQKETKQAEQNEISGIDLNVAAETPKQSFPIYANELGYVYPYSNGFYNGFYYFNGVPTTRPPKSKRRKRFISSRSSHSNPPRSAETTTDYSDDDVSTHNKRYYSTPRYYNYHHHNNHHNHNGWTYHNNHHHHHNGGYNQYHYNSKYYKIHVDQNANQAPTSHHESNLNVDVQEFYPRVQLNTEQETVTKCDVPVPKTNNDKVDDLEQPQQKEQNKVPKNNKTEAPKINKTSHINKASIGRVSKKEIIEGIKSMEQQNINLIATSKIQNPSTNADVEWNVIKKGKKVKVAKDSQNDDADTAVDGVTTTIVPVPAASPIKKSFVDDVKIEPEIKEREVPMSQETNKKTLQPVTTTSSIKSKKTKSKNKKNKKPHFMGKQDGFEIIEPDFGSNSNDKESDEIANDVSGEETVMEELSPENHLANENEETVELIENVIASNEKTLIVDQTELLPHSLYSPDLPYLLNSESSAASPVHRAEQKDLHC